MLNRPTLLRHCGLVASLAAAFCTVAEATERPAADFRVMFRFEDLHYGPWNYEVTPAGLTVSFEGFDGRSRKTMCSAPLASDQAAEWARFISSLSLDKLPSEYIDPNLDEDGVPFYFTIVIRAAGVAPRTIKAVPRPPPELADLCNRIMALVPAGCDPGNKWFCDQVPIQPQIQVQWSPWGGIR